MFSQLATAADVAWIGIAVIAGVTAIAFGVLVAAFRRAPWAYVVAGASIVALLGVPFVAWMKATDSADQFGGGPTMIWLVFFPATRAYALLAAALAAINVALFLKRE